MDAGEDLEDDYDYDGSKEFMDAKKVVGWEMDGPIKYAESETEEEDKATITAKDSTGNKSTVENGGKKTKTTEHLAPKRTRPTTSDKTKVVSELGKGLSEDAVYVYDSDRETLSAHSSDFGDRDSDSDDQTPSTDSKDKKPLKKRARLS